jgi:hypothetical protein
MLEQPALLIRLEGANWTIAEPSDGRVLGFARRCTVHARWRFRWLARQVWQVFEAEDEPLLCTVRRLWGLSPKWEVCDADGHRIGLVRAGRVSNAFGQEWAAAERTAEGFRFRAGKREFARVRNSSEGLCVDFAPELHANPLAKMSLLAAVLVSDMW